MDRNALQAALMGQGGSGGPPSSDPMANGGVGIDGQIQPGPSPQLSEEKIRSVANRLEMAGDAEAASVVMALVGAAGLGLAGGPVGAAAGAGLGLAGLYGAKAAGVYKDRKYDSLNTANPGTEGSF